MEETATQELEAAEVLAALSRSSDPDVQVVAATSVSPQFQTTACEHSTATANQAESNKEQTNNFPQFTETLPNRQLCSTRYRSNHAGKSRSKLTEAEREERRVRRILANRESARQAIRRRQAMYLELKGKAADVLEENAYLKKEKELALKEYTALKEGNEFLKAQIVKIVKAKQREKQSLSRADISSSATPSTCTAPPSHKQPPLIPCVWPSLVPYTDLVQLQNAFSHSNNPTPGPTQQYSPHQGQENNMCSTAGQGIPVFVVPVPWLLPFLSHNMPALHSHPSNDQAHATPPQHTAVSACLDNLQHGGNNNTSRVSNPQLQGWSHVLKAVPGLECSNVGSSGTRQFESPITGNFKCLGEATSSVEPSESIRQRSLIQKKNQESILCQKKDASEVRKKRKELMKMKYLRFHHDKRSGVPWNKDPGI